MQSKPTHPIVAVALCATISISVAPLAISDATRGQNVEQRIHALRNALIGSSAEIATPGNLPEVIAQFNNEAFKNSFNNCSSTVPRTC